MSITLDLGLIADNAHLDAAGKLYLLGEFRYIFAHAVPAQHPHFTVVARWRAPASEVVDKTHMLRVVIVDADGKAIIPMSPGVPIKFEKVGEVSYGQAQAQAMFNVDGLIIPKYGQYVVQFMLDDAPNGEVSFHVAPAPQPKTP